MYTVSQRTTEAAHETVSDLAATFLWYKQGRTESHSIDGPALDTTGFG
jgi:hypothetical protein